MTTPSTAGRTHAVKRRRGEDFDDWFDRVTAVQGVAARPSKAPRLFNRRANRADVERWDRLVAAAERGDLCATATRYVLEHR